MRASLCKFLTGGNRRLIPLLSGILVAVATSADWYMNVQSANRPLTANERLMLELFCERPRHPLPPPDFTAEGILYLLLFATANFIIGFQMARLGLSFFDPPHPPIRWLSLLGAAFCAGFAALALHQALFMYPRLTKLILSAALSLVVYNLMFLLLNIPFSLAGRFKNRARSPHA